VKQAHKLGACEIKSLSTEWLKCGFQHGKCKSLHRSGPHDFLSHFSVSRTCIGIGGILEAQLSSILER
jgi:hypothetical protein